MLDLKKLEEKLDQALEQETPETLTNWLNSKRAKAYVAFLGEGELAPVQKVIAGEFEVKNITSFALKKEETTSLDSPNRCLAA